MLGDRGLAQYGAPCFVALRALAVFPARVFGPLLFFAFRRLASALRAELAIGSMSSC